MTEVTAPRASPGGSDGPYRLDRQLSLTALTEADRLMLADLQGNVLRAHGRAFTRHLFLRFSHPAAARELVAELGKRVTSAEEQLEASSERSRHISKFLWSERPVPPHRERLFVSLLLTARGYQVLGVPPDHWPSDPAWRAGMQSAKARSALGDPPRDTWEPGFRRPIDALLILAYGSRPHDEDTLNVIEHHYLSLMGRRASVVARAAGQVLKRSFGGHPRAVEHFGYADGRSQPLMIQEEAEREARDGVDLWNPRVDLSAALVPCPGGSEYSHGSYLVFRKLEQDTRGFVEGVVASAPVLRPPDPLRAGAMVVGRFPDGTPIALSGSPGGIWHNNFNYASDSQGTRCPLSGHVRKMNPRDDNQDERSHLFVRRGIPYDDRPAVQRRRSPTPGEGGSGDPRRLPAGGVGLLFMCYNSSISNQFEYVQRRWANDPDYLGGNVGVDPIVGQAPGRREYAWPIEWGGPETCNVSFSSCVRLRGGEYFFAPSRTFFANLARN